jgi:hypothetical protein
VGTDEAQLAEEEDCPDGSRQERRRQGLAPVDGGQRVQRNLLGVFEEGEGLDVAGRTGGGQQAGLHEERLGEGGALPGR